MRKTPMLKNILSASVGCIGFMAAAAASGAPLVADWSHGNASLTTTATAISQTIGGVQITAQGFVAEFDGANSRIIGPFPTSTGQSGWQIFGTNTSGITNSGLGLHAQPTATIDATGGATCCALYRPGIENHGYLSDNAAVLGDPLPRLEFVLFSFSQAVTLGGVQVDDTSNFDRDVFIALAGFAPDFTGSFFSAFAGYQLIISRDDASDGFFDHVFTPVDGVTYAAVGALLPDGVSPAGGFENGAAQFYISGFTFELLDDTGSGSGSGTDPGPGEGTQAVVAPGTLSLLAFGMAVVVLGARGLKRRRS